MTSGEYINVSDSDVTGGTITPGNYGNVIDNGNNNGWLFDSSIPVISFTSSPVAPSGDNGWFKGSAPSVSITATSTFAPITTIFYKWDNDSYTSVSGSSVSNLTPSEGTHTLYAYAINEAGKSGLNSPSNRIYKIDTATPTIDIYSNPTDPNRNSSWYKRSVPVITLGNTDATSGPSTIYYSLDSADEFTIYNGQFTIGEGTHTIHYYTKDIAGNINSTFDREYKVDISAPSVSSSTSIDPNSTDSWYKDTTPSITLESTDNVNGPG
jgi:hypothetical protein